MLAAPETSEAHSAMVTLARAIGLVRWKAVTGLRVSQEVELEGLDLGEHGERAYNS